MTEFKIDPIANAELNALLQDKLNSKTKPVGSLGILEKLAKQIGLIQKTVSPVLKNPTLLIFAGDHGITEEGVSQFPQEVTYQMVFNFLKGGAAVCVLSRHSKIDLKIIDAGVNFDFDNSPDLIDLKVGKGTKNFLKYEAMSEPEMVLAIDRGGDLVEKLNNDGCNIVGFGEMGIGNTSSSSVLFSLLGELAIEDCVGSGTGLGSKGVAKKTAILKKSIEFHSVGKDPLQILQTFGGFEIAMIAGAILKAASLKMIVMIDGFIVSAALLVAFRLNKTVLDYCVFCHTSEEKGHASLLQIFEAKPLLSLNMRLGEGSGVAMAYPIINAAVAILNEMASFESAKVSGHEGGVI